MFLKRLSTKISIVFLSACAPIQSPPPPPIQINNYLSQYDQMISSDKRQNHCYQEHLKKIHSYTLPELPNLDSISDNDNQAIVDELIRHIQILRDDVYNLYDLSECEILPEP